MHDPLSGLPTKVMAVKVTTTPTFTHRPPVSLFDAVADNYAVTRDGRRCFARNSNWREARISADEGGAQLARRAEAARSHALATARENS